MCLLLSQSACRALESAVSQGMKSVEVRTDSSYTIKGKKNNLLSHLPLFHLLPASSLLFSPPSSSPFSLSLPAMTEWIGRWRHNGWQTAKHEDVKNKEDLMRLDSLCKQINVRWVGEEYACFRASCYHIQVGTARAKYKTKTGRLDGIVLFMFFCSAMKTILYLSADPCTWAQWNTW